MHLSRKPNLTFACELDSDSLVHLFKHQEILSILTQLRAGIALGLMDFSDQRAEIVKRLNDMGIPLTAWLLLPHDQGYWFNLDNAPLAVKRYREFKKWTSKNGLKWARIGLDIEPDIRIFNEFKKGFFEGFWAVLRRFRSRRHLATARKAYLDLIAEIRMDGLPVESYQLPFIADERKARSTILQRTSGILDLPVDHEILMLYSSFYRPLGAAMLSSYGFQAQGIGIGSTGGGVNLEGIADTLPLSWEELQRDLKLGSSFSQDLFIFSLEGCFHQGFLPKLVDLDWHQPISLPLQARRRVQFLRCFIQAGLWKIENLWLLLGILVAVSGYLWFKKTHN